MKLGYGNGEYVIWVIARRCLMSEFGQAKYVAWALGS
jgi:hypothetical protein